MHKYKREAVAEYEKYIAQYNKEIQTTEYCVEAFEAILTDARVEERKQLNKVRMVEHEKFRPPAEYWWEMRDHKFNKELLRNRVALKPDGSN